MYIYIRIYIYIYISQASASACTWLASVSQRVTDVLHCVAADPSLSVSLSHTHPHSLPFSFTLSLTQTLFLVYKQINSKDTRAKVSAMCDVAQQYIQKKLWTKKKDNKRG